jgi:hypothetical protein
MEGVRQVIGIGSHHQRTVLLGGLLDGIPGSARSARSTALREKPVVGEGGSIRRPACLAQDAVGPHVRVLDIGSRSAIEAQGIVDIEDDILVVVHGEDAV